MRLFPSLHHRKEGCLRHQEDFAKPPKPTQTGWFSFRARSENHPVLAIFGCFAIFSYSLGNPSLRWCKEGNSRVENSDARRSAKYVVALTKGGIHQSNW